MSSSDESDARGDRRLPPGDLPDRSRPIHFVDPDGATWYCHERSARRDPGARGDACLIFDCGDVMRRVWAYPDDWRDLSPDALLDLSWRR